MQQDGLNKGRVESQFRIQTESPVSPYFVQLAYYGISETDAPVYALEAFFATMRHLHYKATIRVSVMLRSVAILHVLDYLYWITSNYGVSTLSLDDGSTFCQPISTQHSEATRGMFTFTLMRCL